MSDDDGFFDDNFFCADETLAALDSVVAEYAARVPPPTTGKPDNLEVSEPLPKRQRLDNVQETRVSDARIATDDLPEISVSGVGMYGLPPGVFRDSDATWNVIRHSTGTASIVNEQIKSGPSGSMHADTNITMIDVTKRNVHLPRSNGSRPSSRVPQSGPVQRGRNRHPSPQLHQLQASGSNIPSSGLAPPQISTTNAVEARVQDLLTKLKESEDERRRIQLALEEAKKARFSKEGEVTILRQTIEKTAKDYAAQISRLKADKEEADARQVQMQRDRKDEMERLKTEFIFKQQEAEASRRPSSVRSKRAVKEVYSQALPMSLQMQGWNPSRSSQAGPSTPRRPKIARNLLKTPEKPQKLLDFQNAFMPSPPLLPRNNTRESTNSSSQILMHSQAINSPISSSSRRNRVEADSDVNMDDDFKADSDEAVPSSDDVFNDDGNTITIEDQTEVFDLEPFDWKAELFRILLTHTSSSSHQPTLLSLTEAPIVTATHSNSQYSEVVSNILAIVGMSRIHDYPTAAIAVSPCLVSMASVLATLDITSHLIGMLDLLVSLIHSLPSFSSILLSQTDSNGDSRIMVLLSSIIHTHLQPSKDAAYPKLLAKETLDLLEVLCWNVATTDIDKLGYICQNRDVFAVLLHNHQPNWVLSQVTHFLIRLMTYPQLCHYILAFPTSESEQPVASETTKYPVLDRLCSFLIDINRQDDECLSMKTHILIFFALVSIADAKAFAVLTSSVVLVPSLVICLHMLTTPLWEEDEKYTSSADLTLTVVRLMNHTLYLLHNIVSSDPTAMNLRQKLLRAPPRHFNGIMHMFTLTFGRLSYSPLPDWMPVPAQLELNIMSEMARDMVELVLDQPEDEAVWTALQDTDLDEGNVTNEDDMEEELMGQ
ncbi:uncharacterized protein EV420DRAFT_1640655 [Desarmillaria tabescens]|uniref:Uncharacterized protein n=1 Tax=Armillaria tabescens TaxID=1929756 RepID=A0AA39TVV7_ARMTA|nr:uncharacterized protein EV420DRAFT_1640655 [Desarmillaria tabescens]KAK0461160.1 hypothetical protein EV420DRAFT_1640655 [Desarmillaria tabescens]